MSSSSESEKEHLESRSVSGSESDSAEDDKPLGAHSSQRPQTAAASNLPDQRSISGEHQEGASKQKSRKKSKTDKRLEKREIKTKKLLLAVVKTASAIESCLTDQSHGTNEKALTKFLLEHEKVLEKLSRYIHASKASYLDESIPIGLLRTIDTYEDPYEWIKTDVLEKLQNQSRELSTALEFIGNFRKEFKTSTDTNESDALKVASGDEATDNQQE